MKKLYITTLVLALVQNWAYNCELWPPNCYMKFVYMLSSWSCELSSRSLWLVLVKEQKKLRLLEDKNWYDFNFKNKRNESLSKLFQPTFAVMEIQLDTPLSYLHLCI